MHYSAATLEVGIHNTFTAQGFNVVPSLSLRRVEQQGQGQEKNIGVETSWPPLCSNLFMYRCVGIMAGVGIPFHSKCHISFRAIFWGPHDRGV